MSKNVFILKYKALIGEINVQAYIFFISMPILINQKSTVMST